MNYGFMWSMPRYEVRFSDIMPEDKIMMIGDVIHVPEILAYKFIFMNNDVSEQNIKFATNHALQDKTFKTKAKFKWEKH